MACSFSFDIPSQYSKVKMSLVILSFCVLWLLVAVSKTNADEAAGDHCPLARHIMGNIGGVIDYRSRVGKEQKVAMEMAVEDFARSSCSKQLVLQLEDSRGDSARAASSSKAYLPRSLTTTKKKKKKNLHFLQIILGGTIFFYESISYIYGNGFLHWNKQFSCLKGASYIEPVLVIG